MGSAPRQGNANDHARAALRDSRPTRALIASGRSQALILPFPGTCQWVPAVAEAGGKLYTFHLEAVCMCLFFLSFYACGPARGGEADGLLLGFFWRLLSFVYRHRIYLGICEPDTRHSTALARTRPPADPLPVINEIHAHNMLAGLAISPQTPASRITDAAFAAADMILVMTVHPGKGGQKFMPECLEKVKELRARFGWDKDVQVDGGVGPGNICQCAQAGTLHPLSFRRFMGVGADGERQAQTSSSPGHPYSRPTSRQK